MISVGKNTPLKNKGYNKGWKNLKPMKKGEKSRNPKGRPTKDRCFSDISNEVLSAKRIKITYTYPTKDGPQKKTVDISSDKSIYHGIIAALATEALNGNVQAAKELIDRTDGKAPQSVDLTSKDEKLESAPVIQVVDKEASAAVSKLFKG